MKRFTATELDRIAQTVQEIERTTRAEIVVAVHRQSGSYRDVDMLGGLVVSLVGVSYIVLNPWTVHRDYLLPADMLLLFLAGFWVSRARPGIRRLLCRAERRKKQVHEASQAFFTHEGVSHTRGRTGILVFVSGFERRIEVVADVGVADAVKPDRWNASIARLREADTLDSLVEGLRDLGCLLSECLPAAADRPHELPTRPTVDP